MELGHDALLPGTLERASQYAGICGVWPWDRLGGEFSDAEREAVVHAHPRSRHFKEDIIRAFYDGICHKLSTTFGNVKADVLADKDPDFRPTNFCNVIRRPAWPA